VKKEPKDKAAPKGETPFGKFEQLAKKVVTSPKPKPEKGSLSQ
jgi:hypothetical protein